MYINDYLNNLLKDSFNKCGYEDNLAFVINSQRPEVCDFQCNASFALSKKLGINPQEIAKNIINNLPLHDTIVTVEFAMPAFINFKFTNYGLSKFANELNEDKNLGIKQTDKPLNVIMDYGGANIAKELHVGHLRPPIIGESLKRLYKSFGHHVISDSHLGDWGLQMGLTIAELQDDGYLDSYFTGKGSKKEITLDLLNEEYPKASKRKNVDSDFKKKADDYTLYIQRKKEPFYTIYKEIKEASLKAIKKNYATLNSFYDLWYGESDAADYTDLVVNIFKEKGLARISDGALVVDVAREGEHIPIPKKSPDEPQMYKNPMPPCIIKKYNDGDLYATTDIATIYMRNLNGAPDQIIYVTDSRQGMHFTQVFRASKLAGISPENQELIHVPHGTIKGTDGKPFKTRSGETIRLEDIIDLITSKAEQKLKANGIENDKKLALQIGVGAMKYGDLSNECSKDYVFDIDKFTSFEGKTGPYIQYTAVRIKSLLNKAGEFEFNVNITTPEERNVLININKLIESYSLAFKGLTLSPICTAVYNLAASYSNFYNNIRILNERNKEKRNSFLSISKLTLKCIEKALGILATDIPDKM